MSFSSVLARLTLLALLFASTFCCFYKSRRLRQLKFSLNFITYTNPNLSHSRAKIFFVSQTGTSEALACRLFDLLSSKNLPFDLVDPKDYEPEDLPKESLVFIIASTLEDGKPPPNAKFFSSWLFESVEDFKVGSLLLSRCKFAVIGVGSGAYGATFNVVARDYSKQMRALGAKEF